MDALIVSGGRRSSREANPLTHIEALELDCVPLHLIVLGGGYVGVEMSQAYRRFGGRVTIIDPGPQIMAREDDDVAEEIGRILRAEGVDLTLGAQPTRVDGRNGESVSVAVRTSSGARTIEGTHLLVAVGRTANTADIGLDKAGVALTPHNFVEVDDRLKSERARNLGDRRMRREPAVHACFGR
jgi:pyruvate/2-oxoglutarate dehydrogenase complex dihydrolipoamide dehydrogenase (E3) component